MDKNYIDSSKLWALMTSNKIYLNYYNSITAELLNQKVVVNLIMLTSKVLF